MLDTSNATRGSEERGVRGGTDRPELPDLWLVADPHGAVYTTNSHFPTYQSEGGVPTLLRISPLP